MPAPSIIIGDSTFPALTSLEVEVSSLNMEEACTFIITYQSTFSQDPSDSEIRDHLARETKNVGVG